MKNVLRKLLRAPAHKIKKYKTDSALARLLSHEHLKVKAVGEALRDSLTKRLSVAEQELINAIERRRSFLLGSDRTITKIDYGAGQPGSNRTKDDMEKGVQSKELVADICRASKPAFWATVLFKMIRKLEPASCVELGSCVGISASYQAAALYLNGKGRLQTLEGAPEVAGIAEETLAGLNLQNASVVTGPFYETLKGVLESSRPVDFFFNDGHHDHDAVLEYFNVALPSLSVDAVIVFDDISLSPGMRKAWTQIEDDERVAASIDLQTMGIALLGKRAATQARFRIPL